MEEIVKHYFGINTLWRGRNDIPDEKREILPVLFDKMGLKKGAEIGVEKGKFSKVLCDLNPGVELFCIDAWDTIPGYREHVTQEQLDGFQRETAERLEGYNAHIIKGYSLDRVKEFDDESLDFVYIDGNHDFQNVVNDVIEWSKKVRTGGVISGHDYTDRVTGVRNDTVAVLDAYTKAFKIEPWFVLKGDRSSSWFWVKK